MAKLSKTGNANIGLHWPRHLRWYYLFYMKTHMRLKGACLTCASPDALVKTRGWYDWAGSHWIVQTIEVFLIAHAILEGCFIKRMRATILFIVDAFENVVQFTY